MIDILMATYNGEKYLEEQLGSILQQSYEDWRLIIGDDCSTDGTIKILEKYQENYPQKIQFYINKKPSGSAKNNFYQLMDFAQNDYIMLADQDDVWLEDKIKITLNKMKEAEYENGKERPLLIHTDLCVVDEGLHTISKSIFKMQNMDCRRDKLNNLLVSNIVTGCTVMINKALLKFMNRKPQNSVMHDMWLALVASAFGKICFIEETTLLYRQHGDNANGAKDVGSFGYFLQKLFGLETVHTNLALQYAQAGEFLEIYGDKLNEKQKSMLKAYSGFSQKNIWGKYRALEKYGLYKNGFIKIIGQLLC